MMKKLISLSICLGFVGCLSACSFYSHDSGPQSPTREIYSLLQDDVSLQEVSDPNLWLPADIYSGQVLKYFKIGDIFLALVLRSSMNISLSLPTVDTQTTFGWILIAREWVSQWSKLTEIEDRDVALSTSNNPYYLTINGQKRLVVTIVDTNGAGSGEGIMKVFVLDAQGTWSLEDCYYFGMNLGTDWIDNLDKYLAYSINFAAQTSEPMDSCQNMVNIVNFS